MLAMLLLMTVQNVPGPPGDEVVPPRLIQPKTCKRGDEEIMVCGGGLQSQRLEPLPAVRVDPMLPQAEAQLSPNKRIGLHATSSSNPMITAPRAMVDLTIKF